MQLKEASKRCQVQRLAFHTLTHTHTHILTQFTYIANAVVVAAVDFIQNGLFMLEQQQQQAERGAATTGEMSCSPHTHTHTDTRLKTANGIGACRSERACAWRSLAHSTIKFAVALLELQFAAPSHSIFSFLFFLPLPFAFANFRSLKLPSRLVNYFTLLHFTIAALWRSSSRLPLSLLLVTLKALSLVWFYYFWCNFFFRALISLISKNRRASYSSSSSSLAVPLLLLCSFSYFVFGCVIVCFACLCFCVLCFYF